MPFQPQERAPPTLTGGLLESEAGPRGLSAEFGFCCPGLQHDGPSPALGFPRVPLLPRELRRVGLLLRLASSVEVVSATFYPGHGTIDVTRVYAPRFFVSSQQKFGVMDIKAPWRVTALGGQTVL